MLLNTNKRGTSSAVEHIVANDKATGSIPVSRSKPTSSLSLMNLAKQINVLLKTHQDAKDKIKEYRIEIGMLLLEVEKRLPKESDMTFGNWCYNYLSKKDGTAFSYTTIKNYMKYANNPETLRKERKRQAEYSRRRTKALKYVSGNVALNATTTEEQLNRLIYAWDHADDKARKQFLEMTGLKYAKR